ncbi:MAG: hypothetical protein PVJ57_00830 [Phycisphaerae bacterium]|jgi:hypothetical protein
MQLTHHRPILVAGLSLLLAASAGCAPRARLVLHQPTAPPAQQHLEIASDWSYCADDNGRRQVLLAFPLPGAKDGPRDFLVHLATPPGEGTYPVDEHGPGGVQGFLIQAVGARRGKTVFTGGEVCIRPAWLARHRWKLTLDVQCSDGTRIEGDAVLSPAAAEWRTFKRRYAADLAPTATQPADEGRPTESRVHSAP